MTGSRTTWRQRRIDADPAVARVHLLPGFDEYVLGYQDRSAVLAPEHSQAIVPGGNGVFRPTIVVDGAVVGTWRRTVQGAGGRRGGDAVRAADPTSPGRAS